MSDPEPFTADEVLADVGAARIRGIILDTIASRVGQVPDVHPNLLEGIEAAARILAELGDGPAAQERDGRLLQLFLSGFAAGTSGEVIRQGAPVAYAHHYGAHIAQHIADDPIACAQVLEGLVPLWETGTVPPDAPGYIQVHGGHEGEG